MNVVIKLVFIIIRVIKTLFTDVSLTDSSYLTNILHRDEFSQDDPVSTAGINISNISAFGDRGD